MLASETNLKSPVVSILPRNEGAIGNVHLYSKTGKRYTCGNIFSSVENCEIQAALMKISLQPENILILQLDVEEETIEQLLNFLQHQCNFTKKCHLPLACNELLKLSTKDQLNLPCLKKYISSI